MPFHVRDTATDTAVRRLARLTGKTLTDTIRDAVDREYAAIRGVPPLLNRLQSIQADFQAMKRASGQLADKTFFDDMWGNG
jgi:antitoxin VapB